MPALDTSLNTPSLAVDWPLGGAPAFTWSAPSGASLDHFRMFRATTDDFTTAADVSGSLAKTATGWSDSGASRNGTAYYWWLVGFDAAEANAGECHSIHACQNVHAISGVSLQTAFSSSLFSGFRSASSLTFTDDISPAGTYRSTIAGACTTFTAGDPGAVAGGTYLTFILQQLTGDGAYVDVNRCDPLTATPVEVSAGSGGGGATEAEGAIVPAFGVASFQTVIAISGGPNGPGWGVANPPAASPFAAASASGVSATFSLSYAGPASSLSAGGSLGGGSGVGMSGGGGGGGGGSGGSGAVLAAGFVTLSGTTPTLHGHQNVASVTRNSTGQFTIAFTADLPTADYGFLGGGKAPDANNNDDSILVAPNSDTSAGFNTYSTAAIDIVTAYNIGTLVDPQNFSFIIYDPASTGGALLAAVNATVAAGVATINRGGGVSAITKKTSSWINGVFEVDLSPALGFADYSAFAGLRTPDTSGLSLAAGAQGNDTTSPGYNAHAAGVYNLVSQSLNTGDDIDPGTLSLAVLDLTASITGVLAAGRISTAGGVCTLIESFNLNTPVLETTFFGHSYKLTFTTNLGTSNYGVIASAKAYDAGAPAQPAPMIAGPTGYTGDGGLYHSYDGATLDLNCHFPNGGNPVACDVLDVIVFDPAAIQFGGVMAAVFAQTLLGFVGA